jgi:dTDP-4-amino-4,6-dideoxygalactose transaminase
MRKNFLPFSPPLIGEEEIDAVVDTLRSGWLTTGPKTGRFEREFAEYVASPAALALNSCTAGLHTALVTLGIGPGDEVITTPMTFAASVNVIEHVGARPVLADVEPDTLNIAPDCIEAAISPRTKAIIPVHYAGHPVDLDAINALAAQYDLAVVEDAAHAISAKYRGRPIGSGPNPAAFSFYATKNLTTGEGGMLTGSHDFLAQARIISLHGMDQEAWKRYQSGGRWQYDIVSPGFKYNMTDIQAAIGIQQLLKLHNMQQRRREVVESYHNAFAALDELELPSVRPEVESAYHLYVVRLKPGRLRISRNQFVEQLTERNIGTSVHFIPIHRHSYYRDKYGFQPDDFPVASQNAQRILSLPLNPRMSDQDVADVIDAVHDVVQTYKVRRFAA